MEWLHGGLGQKNILQANCWSFIRNLQFFIEIFVGPTLSRVRRLDGQHQWFVIDWEELLRRLNLTSTVKFTPRFFSDGHGEEVDIRGVGTLISQCESLYISEELRSLGKRMRHKRR